MTGGIEGRQYLEAGSPVVVLRQWRTGRHPTPAISPAVRRTGPARVIRNVLIRRCDGQIVVRTFRGLRLPKGPA